jgi:hypothetical protein
MIKLTKQMRRILDLQSIKQACENYFFRHFGSIITDFFKNATSGMKPQGTRKELQVSH